MMAIMDRANWERLQRQLPPEERQPYPGLANSAPSTESSDTKLTAQAVPGIIPGYGVGTETANNQVSNTEYPNAGKQTTDGSSTTKVPQELPPGFTPGAFPAEFAKWFGEPPADIMGWKITPYTNSAGETYYKLSISQKGAYGDARWGSSEFGAPIAKDKNGAWTLFQGDYSTGSSSGKSSSGSSNKPGVYTASDGKEFTDQQAYVAYETSLRNNKLATDAKLAEDKASRQSAYDLLYSQFKQYGLESLVEGIKGLIQDNVSPSEFSIRLQNTDAYKKRFAANQDRINKGLRALTPAEYLSKEDAYQEIMRRYGLPESYYAKGDLGIQEGFNKLIANDVSDAELEDRVITAQERVINANPDILKTLKSYYPDITNGDILAYALDPKNALNAIKKKVTAAEIGVAAMSEGLTSGLSRAEELVAAGVTAPKYLQAAPFISQAAERGSQLADIYKQQPYTQATAEAEALDLAGSAQAAKQRKKLSALEGASFSGQAGTAQGALERGRQGAF